MTISVPALIAAIQSAFSDRALPKKTTRALEVIELIRGGANVNAGAS